jgi:hypothetical protein
MQRKDSSSFSPVPFLAINLKAEPAKTTTSKPGTTKGPISPQPKNRKEKKKHPSFNPTLSTNHNRRFTQRTASSQLLFASKLLQQQNKMFHHL